MTEGKKITVDDEILVTLPDLYGHEPREGDWFYVWVPEKHPDFEWIRDDFYGWATHRGIAPDDLWSGIVPAAKLPFRLIKDIQDSYGEDKLVWVNEFEWRRRCRGKPLRRQVRRDQKKKK